MKMHIGVDETSGGVIHSMETTAANVHNITQTERPLYGKGVTCYGDADYLGVKKREELKDKEIKWEVSERPSRRKTMNTKEQFLEKTKASIRAKVDYSFRTIKRQFGYD